MRGIESFSSVERSLSRGAPGKWCEVTSQFQGTLSRVTRNRDLESVQTLSERRNLHVYLEQKTDLAVRGECAAPRRLSEAEADLNLKDWSSIRRINWLIRLKEKRLIEKT